MNIKLLAKLGEETVTGVGSTENSFGKLFGTAFSMVVTVGGLFALYHLIMGALNWINSQGDKEKLTKAQKQITNALIGLVILVVIWVLFFTVAGDILGIFQKEGNEYKIVIPSLFGN